MIRDIQDEVMRLKKENDVCILAHLYQNDAILEVADYTGDSFALAKLAQTVPNKTVLMCGVRFMAETVKMLAPDKRVLLSNPDAGCPMAEQMDREVIEQVKENYPDYTVVAYINTTAELKTVCDVWRALYGGDGEDAGAGQAGAAEQSGRRLPYGGADGPGSDRTGERELPGLYRGGVYQHYGGA
jgi:hypothetical protein